MEEGFVSKGIRVKSVAQRCSGVLGNGWIMETVDKTSYLDAPTTLAEGQPDW